MFRFKRMISSITILIMISMLIVGCSSSNNTEDDLENRKDAEAFALDTIVSFSVWDTDDEVLNQAVNLCYKYDKLFSKSVEKSDIYKLNHSDGKSITVDDETVYLIEKSVEYSKLSNGNFDITIMPVKELWDFKSENPKVPSNEALSAELKKVGYQNIVINGNEITLKNGAQIDLGGIAKGYIADKIKEHFTENGVKKAIINLGGNVLMLGQKDSDTLWTVGIQHPDKARNESLGTVKVKDKSVVTSGVYERYFEVDGKIYHHLLNPFDGQPANNGVASVTIISDNSLQGDVLSTTCFVLGYEKGIKLIESLENVEAIYVLDDLSIKTSSGIDKYDFEVL